MTQKTLNYDQATGKFTDPDTGDEVNPAELIEQKPDAQPPATTSPPANASGEAGPQTTASRGTGDGVVLDAEGGASLTAVRFTEKEATDTEPAEYVERVGRLVVSTDGAVRFEFIEPKEGGSQ